MRNVYKKSYYLKRMIYFLLTRKNKTIGAYYYPYYTGSAFNKSISC